MGQPGGPEAKAALVGLVDETTWPVLYLRTIKDRRERYGRYRAVLYYTEGDAEDDLWDRSVNWHMVDAGHAVAVDYR